MPADTEHIQASANGLTDSSVGAGAAHGRQLPLARLAP